MDTLLLRLIDYPHEKVPLWSITAAEVEQAFLRGNIPQILLPDVDYSQKPHIAVILAQDKHPDRIKEDYTVFPDYVQAVLAAGGVPVFIAYDYVKEQLFLRKPDAVLLIGGNFRLVKKHPAEPYERRPGAYVRMIEYAMHHNLPTFAICGGMQMLGVYKGAGVNTELNRNLDDLHSHLQDPYVLSQEVFFSEDSLIYRILQQKSVWINSCHNTALKGNRRYDFTISGRTADGTVEVIEFAHPWSDFVLAVQWHPERLAVIGDENSLKLFAAFIKAAREHYLKVAD